MRQRWWALLAAVVVLSACTTVEEAPVEDRLRLSRASFSDLPGWARDDLTGALAAFRLSCDALQKRPPETEMQGGFAGTAADWQGVCAAARPAPGDTARAFFEAQFTPYLVSGDKGPEGLFTGYYQPLLRGSLEKKAPYLTPLYARPDDLVSVNLGDFSEDLKGKTIQGRVVGQNLTPYFDRSEIEKGALDKAQVPSVVWVDDPIDAFFLHIQGSGLVMLEDGSELQVGYAAQNGRTYHAIGKTLIERGVLSKEDVSMQSIRQWLEQNPTEAADLMNLNPSYVFFRRLEGAGPLGAQGVALTPGRSLAVDRRHLPYGLPVFLDAEEPDNQGRLQRLMIAQDTGGAIKGVVRGDYFWGAGETAADKAGRMKSKGRYYVLVPKHITVPASVQK